MAGVDWCETSSPKSIAADASLWVIFALSNFLLALRVIFQLASLLTANIYVCIFLFNTLRGNVYEHPDLSVDGFKEDDSETTLISKIFNMTKFPSEYELIINDPFRLFLYKLIKNPMAILIFYASIFL